MDRTQLCGSCNVGSIPTESTEKGAKAPLFFVLSVGIEREGVGKRKFPVEGSRRGFILRANEYT